MIVYTTLIVVLTLHVVLRDSAMAQWAGSSSVYDECHDDLKSNPADFADVRLRFPWLAFLQFIRIKDGMLYHGRVPRVVMVHRQYVLATAADVTDVPDGYSLGNVVFKDYDRDETECGFTMADLRAGADCNPSDLVMPIVDVIIHPEYLDEANRPPDSIAVVKLMQTIESDYMLPICLPFFDLAKAQRESASTFIIDFESKIPQAFDVEKKYSQKLQVLPTQLCNRIQKFTNVSQSHWPLALCTSGCGMSRGAPLVIHLRSGWWVLVALASRPVLCMDTNIWRSSRAEPNRFVSVLPYVDWITNTTTGKVDPWYTQENDANDPFGYKLLQGSTTKGKFIGRTFVMGDACDSRRQITLYHYYKETFNIHSDYNGDINYYLNMQPGTWYKVACVKVTMPSKILEPIIEGFGHWNVTVRIPGVWYIKDYEIILQISATEASDDERRDWTAEKTRAEQVKKGLIKPNT